MEPPGLTPNGQGEFFLEETETTDGSKFLRTWGSLAYLRLSESGHSVGTTAYAYMSPGQFSNPHNILPPERPAAERTLPRWKTEHFKLRGEGVIALGYSGSSLSCEKILTDDE